MLTLKQGLFKFLCCPAREEVGRGPNQDSWSQLTRGTSHPVWCCARHSNWEEVTGGCPPIVPDHWLGPGQQVLVHHIFSVFPYHYVLFLFCHIKLPLSQPMNLTFLSSSVPYPICWGVGWGMSEWMAQWCLAACHVKPQHWDRSIQSSFANELLCGLGEASV